MLRLSAAQQRALAKIEGHGHSYGEGAYLSRATAQALARKGLIVLGTVPRSCGERRMAWAVTVGAKTLPYGWRSDAESKAQWDLAMAEIKARQQQQAASQQARREKVIATSRAARLARGEAVGAAWEAEARRLLEDLRVLAQAERLHAERAAQGAQ